MPTPYRVRLFRQAQNAEDRRRVYEKASRRDKGYIRRNDPWCVQCFNRLALKSKACIPQYAPLCYECYRTYRYHHSRRYRLSRSARIAQLPVHKRICIDCHSLFDSERGQNLCLSCIEKVREEIASRSLSLEPFRVDHKVLVTALYHRYGHLYHASLVPRIPLHSIDVLGAIR